MKHKFLLLYSWLVRALLYFLPDIPIIMRFRGWLYGFGMARSGKNFQVTHSAIIKPLQCLSVGNDVYIANNVVMLCAKYVFLEDGVMIGPSTVISAGNHTLLNGSFRFGRSSAGTILIKKGAWIGANCTVLKDSCLPECSVLGANSLLNKQFDEKFCLYAGSPARLISKLKV